MAGSRKFVFLRTLIGRTVTEIVLDSGEMAIANVTILDAGYDHIIVEQAGSGGMGTIFIPIQNIAFVVL